LKGDILWTKTVTGMTTIRETGTMIREIETMIRETATTIRETVTRTIVRTGKTITTATDRRLYFFVNAVQKNKKPQASYSPFSGYFLNIPINGYSIKYPL
jgi:hypothetical protein